LTASVVSLGVVYKKLNDANKKSVEFEDQTKSLNQQIDKLNEEKKQLSNRIVESQKNVGSDSKKVCLENWKKKKNKNKKKIGNLN